MATVAQKTTLSIERKILMIRVFSGGRYNTADWSGLMEILENGLQDICCNDCDTCQYTFCCREVSQAVTYCANQLNHNLANRDKGSEYNVGGSI